MRVRDSTLLLLAALLLPASVQAQVGKPRPRLADSTGNRADTAGVQDSVAAYEKLEAAARTRVPVAPRLGGEGPLPASSRIVLTRDSMDWSGAVTLADLLARVPGTYIWRGGGLGRPEMVDYAGRGTAALEVLLDGMPYDPIGPDSVAIDPATIPLGIVDRVEIERWPSTLRVMLYTPANDRLAARSHIVLAAGPGKLAKYEVSLERRFKGGFGIGAAGDYLKVPPPAGATGIFQRTGYWAQLSYVPSARTGLMLEYLGNSLDRDAFSDGVLTGPALEGRRGEMRARAFYGGRPDGTGLRLDLLGSRAGWDSMGVKQTIWRGGAALNLRAPLVAASGAVFLANRWTRLDASGRVSWTPLALVTLAGEGVYRRYDGARDAAWIGGRAGIGLPGGFELSATGRAGHVVSAPSLAASPEQPVREVEGALLWNTGRLGAEGRIARTKSFVPDVYQEFPGIVVAASTPGATWLTAGGFVRPLDWITVRGWYSQATTPAPDGAPPRHWSVTGTIRSRLLHTFRSGAFDLKLELGYEGWRAGVLGQDAGGAPVVLSEAHYLRSLVQVGIESFSVFWESRNLSDEAVAYVPGFRIPRFSGVFGVRWGFMN